MEKVSVFVAYGSRPESGKESIREAIRKLNASSPCEFRTWEALKITGKPLISTICHAIDECPIFFADVSFNNPNVLFEAGYALVKNKVLWLVKDGTLSPEKTKEQQIRFLKAIGYSTFSNSSDIVSNFLKDKPWEDLESSLLSLLPESQLKENVGNSQVLHLKLQHDTDASIHLAEALRTCKLPVVLCDPRESSSNNLSWYLSNLKSALGVIAHLSGPSRDHAEIHNAQYSFVSGMAYGLGKPILMLAEEGFESPLDYYDLLYNYRNFKECKVKAEEWLAFRSAELISLKATKNQREQSIRRDLRSLDLGDPLAENERDSLPSYFLETREYLDVIARKNCVIAGRKGSGKTACMQMAEDHFSRDARNVVCPIVPVGYDIQGVVRLFAQYRQADQKGYVSESLWKFLIYTEIARIVGFDLLDKMQRGVSLSLPEESLVHLLSNNPELKMEFSIRLESVIKVLMDVVESNDISTFQSGISEKLHKGILKDIRELLGQVIGSRKICVLVDNLDKAWTPNQDTSYLSDFLFGLMRITSDDRKDLGIRDRKRTQIDISLAVFLRSDILRTLLAFAREPDKINAQYISWNDEDVLFRVIQERINALSEDGRSAKNWDDYFCATVDGKTSKDFVLQSILPRPRDILMLVREAVSSAINRKKSIVGEKELRDARQEYSSWICEAVLIENGVSRSQLKEVIFNCLGLPRIVSIDAISECIFAAGVGKDRFDYCIRHLVFLSFLGPEVKEGDFRFVTESSQLEKVLKLHSRYISSGKAKARFRIHEAFADYLELTE